MLQDIIKAGTLGSALPKLTHLSLEPGNSTQIPGPSGPPTTEDPEDPREVTPFQFGTRLLTDPDNVFEHNAWDHVETDEAYRAVAAEKLKLQRANPVDEFNKHRFNSDPAKWWDMFYKNNSGNFFKDRKWLQQEFPLLAEATREGAGKFNIVELGCGAGNTLFPLLRLNKNAEFCIHGCDFSRRAVEIVKENPLFAEEQRKGTVAASVYDISRKDSLPSGVLEGSVDAVVMVFVFSALSPDQWSDAVANVRRMLRKGGKILFRDYGRGDLTQVRFKGGRYLEENFYVRGDGTRVYFFEEDELRRIFAGEEPGNPNGDGTEGGTETSEKKQDGVGSFPEGEFGGFAVSNLGVDRRMLVNRSTQVRMYRCWMQAVFEKL